MNGLRLYKHHTIAKVFLNWEKKNRSIIFSIYQKNNNKMIPINEKLEKYVKKDGERLGGGAISPPPPTPSNSHVKE
jgi:hypothetical protein